MSKHTMSDLYQMQGEQGDTGMKEVSKEEFDKFLEEYPGRLNHNFYMGWYQFHDADTHEEVAKLYEEYGPGEYWIKE